MLSFKLYLTCGCEAGTLGVLAGDGLGTGGLVIGTLALMDFMLELELSLLLSLAWPDPRDMSTLSENSNI